MTAFAFSLVLAAALTLALRLVGHRAGGSANNFALARDAERELAKTAELLLADDSVPETVILFVDRFVRAAHRPRLARQFAGDFITGRLSRRTAPEPGSHRSALFDALQSMPTDQQAAFGTLIASGLATSALADILLAPLHKRLITNFVSATGRPDKTVSLERTRTVAIDVFGYLSALGCAAQSKLAFGRGLGGGLPAASLR